jgi:hypothetical protein
MRTCAQLPGSAARAAAQGMTIAADNMAAIKRLKVGCLFRFIARSCVIDPLRFDFDISVQPL